MQHSLMKYSLDASTLIFILRNDESVVKNFKTIIEAERYKILIPPVAYFEVLRGLKSNKALKSIKHLESIYKCVYIPKSSEITDLSLAKKASEIFIKQKELGLPLGNGYGDNDIFIAAWSMLLNATLVTDNVKHFQSIDGLQITNWKER